MPCFSNLFQDFSDECSDLVIDLSMPTREPTAVVPREDNRRKSISSTCSSNSCFSGGSSSGSSIRGSTRRDSYRRKRSAVSRMIDDMDSSPAKRYASATHMELYDCALSTVDRLFAGSLKSLSQTAVASDNSSNLSPADRARVFFILFNSRIIEIASSAQSDRKQVNMAGILQGKLQGEYPVPNPCNQDYNYNLHCLPAVPGLAQNWTYFKGPDPALPVSGSHWPHGRGPEEVTSKSEPSSRVKMYRDIFRRSLQAYSLSKRSVKDHI